MDELYQLWLEQLSKQESLLAELLNGINQEKKALLAHELDGLRESTLLKDKAARKLALCHDELSELRKKTARALSLPVSATARDIIKKFHKEHQNALEQKRRAITALQKSVKRVNGFNAICLGTFLDHLSGIRRVFNSLRGTPKTYASDGIVTEKSRPSLINRSI